MPETCPDHDIQVWVPVARPGDDTHGRPPVFPGALAGRLHHPAKTSAYKDASLLCDQGPGCIRSLVLCFRCVRRTGNRNLHALTVARQREKPAESCPGHAPAEQYAIIYFTLSE